MVFEGLRKRRLTDLARATFDAEFYLRRAPDVAQSGVDPFEHFLSIGWIEGRDPSAAFSTAHYLRRYPDVAQQRINPFLHWLSAGAAEGREARPPRPSPEDEALARTEFDAGWYAGGFPPHLVPDDLLQHFLTLGWHDGRDPAPWFSTRTYLAQNPDVAAAGVNPFLHYLRSGKAEGRQPLPYPYPPAARAFAAQAAAIGPGPHHEPPLPSGVAEGPPSALAIAYYLPQFHAVPENDRFWGAGFTEWRNVSRALPRFEGHLQPRIPADLGFYDLGQGTATYHRQIALARRAGLSAFCFYHYSFGGRRVLNRPMEAILADPSADFPFTLMWANEDWTRAWDGADRDILLAQDYDPAHDAAVCADFARHFRDPRYLRLGGRPLLFLYRAGSIPDAARRIDGWRTRFLKDHGEEPLIFMAQTFSDHDPRPFGLDGAIEFPPHKANHFLPDLRPQLDLIDTAFSGVVHSYDDMVRFSSQEPPPQFPLIRCGFPSWDNDPRRPGRGTVFHGATPPKFEAWMRALAGYAVAHPVFGQPILAVNAWNEWAEGAVLEPDLHHGHAWLAALARALRSDPPTPRVSHAGQGTLP